MRGIGYVVMAMCLGSSAMAATTEEAKSKPAKYLWSAAVSTDKAIACLLQDNSLNVQTIRQDGYVDMPMYLQSYRALLVTITPEGEGVKVEARGRLARAAMRARPCMGLPAEKGLPKLG